MKNVVKDHLGKEYKTIKEMCQTWNVKVDTFTKRINKGWTLEEALTVKDRSKKTCFDHMGNKYRTIGDMCKAWNVTRSKYDHRINAGWTLEDALTKADCVSIICKDHQGNEYGSIEEMCRAWNVSRAKYQHRIDKGLSLEEALTLNDMSNRRTCKDHLGNDFVSLAEMCRFYKVDRTTFQDRIDRGWTLEEALLGNRKKVPSGSKKCKDYQGNEYANLAQMCRAYGISYQNYKRRIQLGWSQREALIGKDNPVKPNSKECLDHLGNRFNSIVEMCKYWKITPDIHKSRIAANWTLEETLTIPRMFSLGEYRVAEVLDRYVEEGKLECYFHDITIKKLFSYLKIEDKYQFFMRMYEKELENSNISVSRQKLAKFRFDFSLVKNDDLFAFIEFDGEQHFKFVDLFFKTMDNFLSKQRTDVAKNEFAEVNSIPLLRIRYDQVKIETIEYMIADLFSNTEKYILQHNTFMSNDEYMEVFKGKTVNCFEKSNEMRKIVL